MRSVSREEPTRRIVGFALLAAGGLLILVCLPTWFWLTLLGAALVTIGWYMVGVKR